MHSIQGRRKQAPGHPEAASPVITHGVNISALLGFVPAPGELVAVIATVQDPLAAPAILAHLGRSLSPEAPGPAPPAPAASG